MLAFNPKAIIIDTPLVTLDAPMIRFGTEDPDDPSNAISEHAEVSAPVRGIASVGFIRLAAPVSGYTMSTVPWKRRECRYPSAVEDYLDVSRDARRMTVVLRATAATPR